MDNQGLNALEGLERLEGLEASRRAMIEALFDQLENKELVPLINNFADDGILIDPHYPRERMQGHDQILEGLNWGFKNIAQFNFSIVNYYEQVIQGALLEEDGTFKVSLEVDTAHVLVNGKVLNTPQVFVFDIVDNKVQRLQSYVPYGPSGILNIVLKVTRSYRFLKGLLQR